MTDKDKEIPTSPKEGQGSTAQVGSEAVGEQVSQPSDVEGQETRPDTEAESRARRVFRQVLRWSLGLLIVFALGFLAAVYAVYRPSNQAQQGEINGLRAELEAANSQVEALEERVESLEPLIAENETLLATQGDLKLHIAILNARVDIANARLALDDEDAAGALVSLENTGDALQTMKTLLPLNQREVATAMQQRLNLVLEEVEAEPYAAQSDLDVMAKRLLELEHALFGTP